MTALDWTQLAYAVRLQISDDGLPADLAEHLAADIQEDGCLWIGPFAEEFEAIAFATNPEYLDALNVVDFTVVPFEMPTSTKWDCWQ